VDRVGGPAADELAFSDVTQRRGGVAALPPAACVFSCALSEECLRTSGL